MVKSSNVPSRCLVVHVCVCVCVCVCVTLTLAWYAWAWLRVLGKPASIRPFPCRREEDTASHTSPTSMSCIDTHTHTRTHTHTHTHTQSAVTIGALIINIHMKGYLGSMDCRGCTSIFMGGLCYANPFLHPFMCSSIHEFIGATQPFILDFESNVQLK